jgi:predicted DNA-binding transcriptional regulator AlpA
MCTLPCATFRTIPSLFVSGAFCPKSRRKPIAPLETGNSSRFRTKKCSKSVFRGMKRAMNPNRNKNILTLQLGRILQDIHDLGPAEIPALLSQVAALQSALAARLLSVQVHRQSVSAEDRLLTVEEAASRLGTSEDWLYRHAPKLPFTVRLAPRQLRFSSQGIAKYLHGRQGQE